MKKTRKQERAEAARELYIAEAELDRFAGSVFREPVRLAEHQARVDEAARKLSNLEAA